MEWIELASVVPNPLAPSTCISGCPSFSTYASSLSFKEAQHDSLLLFCCHLSTLVEYCSHPWKTTSNNSYMPSYQCTRSMTETDCECFVLSL